MKKGFTQPPRWADRLLERLFHGEALEEVQGDLHESFLWRLEEHGSRHAKWHFIKEIFQSIRFSNLKPYPFMKQLITLFQSHIKTGWRFLWKAKAYAVINILGLSIGIVFSWFAYQYATDQFSYNKHLRHVDQLYKMLMQADMMGNKIFFSGGSFMAAKSITDQLPEVEEAALFAEENRLVKIKNSSVHQTTLVSNIELVKYLNLDFLEGGYEGLLERGTAIISERMAYKLGIRGEATDKFLELQDSTGFKAHQIIGVYRDIPENTSIRTDIILSLAEFLKENPERTTSYSNFDLSIILKFTPHTNIQETNAKINELIREESGSENFEVSLAPMATFHLDNQPQLGNGFGPGGNKQLISFIGIAGILCLIISVINYANFSISQYIHRAREMAMRRIMGAGNQSVFQQLMTEAFLTTILATLLAIVLYMIVAPQFSSFVEKTFDIRSLVDTRFIPGNVALILIISILSGLYPAVLLSKFKLVDSLKRIHKVGKGKMVMQSLLVVQFSISTAMIVCMLVFREQLDLLVNHDKGRDVEDVIRINFPSDMMDQGKIKGFMNGVSQLSIVDQLTGAPGFNLNPYDDGETSFGLMNMMIDSAYMKVLGLRFVEGGDFSSYINNSSEIIVNQAFLRKTNLNDPIGKTIPFGKTSETSTIVGVVQDVFLAKSEAGPEVFFPDKGDRYVNQLFLKTSHGPLAFEQVVEPVWDDFFYPFPLNYQYLEETYNRRLDQENKIAKISGLGSAIAIFVAGFGLLGLVGVTIRQKLKRVSISRVLGAENIHIVMLISQKFILPILISLSIGLAASFYLVQNWLDNYTTRIQLEWYYLASASLIIVGIIALVIWTQVRETLKRNPVIFLKDD